MEYSQIAPMMTHLWAPMAAVTSTWQGKHNAQIAVAISAASIVLEKPRVAIKIQKNNFSHDMIYQSGAFALNFLGRGQSHLIPQFGLVSGRDCEKLADVAYDLRASGSPVLEECWGYLDCRVVNALDGGDMTCFLGDVLEGNTLSDDGPLWWRDAQKMLPAEVIQEWDRKIGRERELSASLMDNIDFTPWRAETRSSNTSR